MGSLVEKIAGTWMFLMLLLIACLWVGLVARWITGFFDGMLGRVPAEARQSQADIDALRMRAKGQGPNIGN